MLRCRYPLVTVVVLLAIAVGMTASARAQSLLDLPAPNSASPLDVTQHTPRGIVRPGGDITAALQWALDNLHLHKRQLLLPAGDWKLSRTVTTPHSNGLTLLGAGSGLAQNTNPHETGSRTRLIWTGPPDGTMIVFGGQNATIGDFVLVGRGADEGGKGIVVKKLKIGLGNGTVRFRPIIGANLGTLVQCGGSLTENNCDNLHFEWLSSRKCGRGYHGVNTQGMDIVFERFDAGRTPVGIEMDGGGSLWVQYSLTVHPSTLLKINNTNGRGVGKYNGRFRLSNTKVDTQAKDGFCLVDSAEPYPIAILADGGLYSYDTANGTFARLCGANHLEIRDWTATFRNIVGVRDEKFGVPTVMLRGSRIWQYKEQRFTGEVNARIRDCVNNLGEWIDWDSPPSN